MTLPDTYKSMMEALLEDYPAYRDSLSRPWERGLRVNTQKIRDPEATARVLQGAAGFAHESPSLPERISWCPEGYYLPCDSAPASHPFYQAGLYYLQEPSAQAPAAELPIRPGDRVLDLCAAPGGKATQLLSRLGGKGFLLANDPSAGRAAALRKNLELFGATNAFVSVEEPERLASAYPGFFDAVLVDAPCSGSGMFRKEPSMASFYGEKGPWAYLSLQASILEAAFLMLRPGGHLMYSTCTFSPEEDEMQVRSLLLRHPEMSVKPLAHADCYEKGIPLTPSLALCGRLYPHRLRGEGQFLALLKKEGDDKPLPEKRDTASSAPAFYESGDCLHLLPGKTRPKPGIRYLMTGLCIARRKGRRLLPTQALAMALQPKDWPKSLVLPADDERLSRYLRGETLFKEADDQILFGTLPVWLPEELDARSLLVTVEGWPLGFAREQNGMLKNLRDPGWRAP